MSGDSENDLLKLLVGLAIVTLHCILNSFPKVARSSDVERKCVHAFPLTSSLSETTILDEESKQVSRVISTVVFLDGGLDVVVSSCQRG